jgi:CRP-like cAMP-binding protein
VTSIFFVRAGELEALRYSSDGEALVMVRAGAGDFFGEPALAVDAYTCAARARLDSELLAVCPKRAMLAALQADQSFATAFLLAQIRNARQPMLALRAGAAAPRRGSHTPLPDMRSGCRMARSCSRVRGRIGPANSACNRKACTARWHACATRAASRATGITCG